MPGKRKLPGSAFVGSDGPPRFVAIAVVSFAAGWLVGTVLTEHVRLI
jgi:hypothetical protein